MEEQPPIDGMLMEGLKHLKTQRLLPIVGQTFLICDTTPVHTDEKRPLIYLPSWICRLFGLKDKTQLKGIKQITVNQFVPYIVLIVGVVLAALYPLFIHKLPGNFLQRLYTRFFVNAAILVPIVLVETQRKATREMFNLSDALGPRVLLKNYLNSLFLTLWSVFFCMGLRYTEISTVLFLGNLMLLVWVFNKIFRRASGISELEVNGTAIFLMGIIIFGVKQAISDYDETKMTSLYEAHKIYGVGFAILASVSAACFFITNYELTYYLPSYTSLLIITVFSLVNLEALNFGLSYLYPASYPFSFLTVSCNLGSCSLQAGVEFDPEFQLGDRHRCGDSLRYLHSAALAA